MNDDLPGGYAPQLSGMPGRKSILESELSKVYAALAEFPLRDQVLLTLGLNTGFRVTELLSLNMGHVCENDHVKSHVKVTRARLRGGKGCRKKAVTSRTVPLNDTATAILQKYLAETLPTSLWQCKHVHFLRNALDRIPRSADRTQLHGVKDISTPQKLAYTQRRAHQAGRWPRSLPENQ